MKSDFVLAFNEIVQERSLPREVVMEALEQALVSAYKRDANIGNNQRVEARIDLSGKTQILLEKEVVERVQTEQTEVSLEEARQYEPDAQVGDTMMVPVETGASFGRIAAQTAKQVILQRIREAERKALYEEFVERAGDLITGTVQSTSGGTVTLSLGRAEAIMPRHHQIPGERYHAREKVRAYVVEVKEHTRGPQIIVSRAHKNMLRRLLEYEVPEIYNGQVEIKSIAREAGQRSKVAVAALQEGVDPVGACVGMRGIRIQNIVRELHNEKIDVIEWNPDPAIFIAKALSPARVSDMLLEEDLDTGRTATVLVSDDQLSLAIGREGQNARLAAKLTGWRIDIKSISEAALEAFERMDEPPLDTLEQEQPELVAEAMRIVEKKKAGRLIPPEEYRTLARFAALAERKLLEVREAARAERRAKFDAVRHLVPDHAFRMPIKELELDDDINKALGRLENVGELMIRVLADEESVERLLRQGGVGTGSRRSRSEAPAKDADEAIAEAMEAIRYALEDLVIRQPAPPPEPVAEPEPEPEPEAETVAEDRPVSVDEVPPAIVEPEPEPEPMPAPAPVAPPPSSQVEAVPAPGDAVFELEDDDEVEKLLEGDQKGRKRKKAKQKRRELIFDEKRGEVVARRRRKGRRRRELDEWEELLD